MPKTKIKMTIRVINIVFRGRKILTLYSGFLFFLILSNVGLQAQSPGVQTNYLNLRAAYANGIGGGIGWSFFQVSRDFPLALHLNFLYTRQIDSGNATEARAIFINDNQGGQVEKYGTNMIFSFDFSYPIFQQKGFQVQLFTGPRFSSYYGHFAFIGDNEEFEVSSKSWGLGAGVMLLIPLNRSLLLQIGSGVDYYRKSRLSGHGEFYYTPDDVDANPRTNGDGYTYDYEDADAAVNQPRWEIIFQLSLSYKIFH